MLNKLLYIVIATLLIGGSVSKAQTLSKAMSDTLSMANKLYKKDQFNKALPFYMSVLTEDSLSAEINFRIGVCKISSKRNRKGCTKYLLKSAELGNLESIVYLGMAYHYEMKFDDAIDAYREYLSIPALSQNNLKDFEDAEVERLIEHSDYASELISDPLNATIKSLGWANTKYSDYAPIISAEESILIFTSRRPGSTGELVDDEGKYFEDLYITYNTDGVWSPPENMGAVVNSEYHDAGIGLSPDGQTLFVYRSNPYGGGDIYHSKLNGYDWGSPEMFENDINSLGVESSASLTSEGDVIYFSSDREGGFGGKDIYKVSRLPNGEWSLAVNLGKDINTPFHEDGPFIHPNGKTLYFSSEGHDNMGGYDIFSSEMVSDTNWTKPENLKYPINTVDDDMYFVLSADGKRAYYSTQRDDGKGETDLYMINMPGNKFNLVFVKGTVKDTDLKNLESALITVVNSHTQEIVGIYKPNSKTGNYIAILDPKKNYYFEVEADNHKMATVKLVFNNKIEFQELVKNITLEKIDY
ncbi:MAG: PD40 domain-containing protein [Flavobacteriales bacterium]|nr:PD40 domain-containing protein [Flavobacteriales bacterium]